MKQNKRSRTNGIEAVTKSSTSIEKSSKELVFTVALILSVFLYSACDSPANIINKRSYPTVHLFLEPTEEHLLDGSYIPDFVNYPDDRIKFGLKEDVRKVEYTSLHKMLWLFHKNGKIAANNIVFSGGWNQEINTWIYQYENDSIGGYDIPTMGHLTGISTETQLVTNGQTLSGGESLHDKVVYNDAGNLTTRSYLLSKKVNYVKQFNYNEKGLCTTMSLTENSSSAKENMIDCNISCDESGVISHIYLRKTRIPVHGLTRGDRSITPVYAMDGKLSVVKSLSIPRNMEAYNMDSIYSISQYEYNEQGDVATWHYTDTVYPGRIVNKLTITFNYIYDTHGNWTEKRMTGEPHILDLIMNEYYRGRYTIESTVDEQGKEWGTIAITRKISYFSEETDELHI